MKKGSTTGSPEAISGDKGTDQYDNATSSEKPGFYSNANAQVTYRQSIGSSSLASQTAAFADPVIQASDMKVRIVKEWTDGEEAHAEGSVTVQLMRVAEGSALDPAPFGDPVTLNAENDWTYTFEHLAKHYVYSAVETPVDGYITTYTSGNVKEGDVTFPLITVTNTPAKRQIRMIKVNENYNPLAGAQFKLYSDEDLKTEITDAGLIESGDDGIFSPEGFALEKGTYYLKETVAPAGYRPMSGTMKIIVSATGVSTKVGVGEIIPCSADADGSMLIYAINYAGDPLPQTGGRGTALYYALGALIMALALTYGCVLMRRRARG